MSFVRQLPGYVLIGVVTAAPWMRGSLFAAPQAWLYSALAVLTAWRLVQLRSDAAPDRPTLPLWCGLGGIAIGLLQLAPLSQARLEHLAPTAAAVSREPAATRPLLGPDDPNSPAVPVVGHAPTSIAPARTIDQLGLLAIGLGVYWLAGELFSDAAARRRLLAFVTLNGAALAFVSLAQLLGDRTLVFWQPHSTWLGPFGNRNNGAGYLILCLAACGGTIWAWFSERSAPDRPQRGKSYFIFATAAALLMTATICASLSRGAVLSLACGLIVTSLLLVARRRNTWAAAYSAAATAIAVGFTAWLGVLPLVRHRLATLGVLDTILSDGRTANWRWGIRAAFGFSPTGSGLGTYLYAYPPFQQQAALERFNYPENAWLQTWVEAGPLGLVLFLIAFVAAAATALRLLGRTAPPETTFLGVMGIFVLASQAVNSCVDNGFYLPANMLLLACLCGVGGSGAAVRRVDEWPTPAAAATGRRAWSARGLSTAVGLALFVGAACTARLRFEQIPVERALQLADRIDGGPTVAAEQVYEALTALSAARGGGRPSLELERRAGEMCVLLYQLQAAEQLQAETGLPRDVAWASAALPQLHAAAVVLEREGDRVGLEALRNQPAIRRFLVPAWRYFQAAHRAVPGEPGTLIYLGELEFLIGDPSGGRPWFHQALRNAPAVPALVFRAGYDLLSGPDRAAGLRALGQCRSLDDGFEAAIARLVPEVITAEEFAALSALNSPQVTAPADD